MYTALARMGEENKIAAEELRRIASENALSMAEQRAKELAIRADLIRQLKAAERVPKQRCVEFDPTDVAGHGILDERSMQVPYRRWLSTY